MLRNLLEANANNKVLADLAIPKLDGFNLTIVRLDIIAINLELKSVMFQMLQLVGQFNRLSSEDRNMHVFNFVAIYDSYKQHQVSEDVIRLRLFPLSLNRVVQLWLNSLASNSITI